MDFLFGCAIGMYGGLVIGIPLGLIISAIARTLSDKTITWLHNIIFKEGK